MRRSQLLFSILSITAIFLSACGRGLGVAPFVKVGWTGEPDTLNPGMATLQESFTIFDLIYDTLYELNVDGT